MIDKEFELQTPVLFLVFNRLDTTRQVFEAIRQAQPPKLYVAADGARESREGEAEKVQAVRDYVVSNIDWNCEVKTLFREQNLGCRIAVSTAIDWFFDNEEQGIILEDDCLPHPTFFRYCQELLYYYRDDERIMAISGDNFQSGKKRGEYSYYFSRYNHIWGWATWRRAWKYYDAKIEHWHLVKSNKLLSDILDDPKQVKYWSIRFQEVYDGRVDTWDYQWTFACWIQNGLTILPNVNLISNIGFSQDATHTTYDSPFANMPVEEMPFPLSHPPYIIRDLEADKYTQKNNFQLSLIKKLKSKLKKLKTV